MAASFTAERKAAAALTSASHTLVFSPATNCTTGSTLYLGVAIDGSDVVSSCSDGVNTWNLDLATSGTGRNFAILSSYQAIGLTTGNSITVQLGGTNTPTAYWLEEFALDYSLKDATANSTGSNSTTLPAGTTGVTVAADEVALVMYCASGGTITKNASYTNFTTGQQTTSGASTVGLLSYRILVATGAQTADGTNSSMVTSKNGIETYQNVSHARVPRNPAINFNDPAFI